MYKSPSGSPLGGAFLWAQASVFNDNCRQSARLSKDAEEVPEDPPNKTGRERDRSSLYDFDKDIFLLFIQFDEHAFFCQSGSPFRKSIRQPLERLIREFQSHTLQLVLQGFNQPTLHVVECLMKPHIAAEQLLLLTLLALDDLFLILDDLLKPLAHLLLVSDDLLLIADHLQE